MTRPQILLVFCSCFFFSERYLSLSTVKNKSVNELVAEVAKLKEACLAHQDHITHLFTCVENLEKEKKIGLEVERERNRSLRDQLNEVRNSFRNFRKEFMLKQKGITEDILSKMENWKTQ